MKSVGDAPLTQYCSVAARSHSVSSNRAGPCSQVILLHKLLSLPLFITGDPTEEGPGDYVCEEPPGFSYGTLAPSPSNTDPEAASSKPKGAVFSLQSLVLLPPSCFLHPYIPEAAEF